MPRSDMHFEEEIKGECDMHFEDEIQNESIARFVGDFDQVPLDLERERIKKGVEKLEIPEEIKAEVIRVIEEK